MNDGVGNGVCDTVGEEGGTGEAANEDEGEDMLENEVVEGVGDTDGVVVCFCG